MVRPLVLSFNSLHSNQRHDFLFSLGEFEFNERRKEAVQAPYGDRAYCERRDRSLVVALSAELGVAEEGERDVDMLKTRLQLSCMIRSFNATRS